MSFSSVLKFEICSAYCSRLHVLSSSAVTALTASGKTSGGGLPKVISS